MPDRRLIDGQFAVGDPIWFDLVTDDVRRAEEFYGRVFGWSFTTPGESRDDEAPAHTGYRVAMIGERSVAGIGRLGTGSRRTPGWWLHLTAPNVKAIAERAEELGGSVNEPVEASGIAELAVARDPQGAEFGLWRPDPLHGHAPTDTPGTVHWAELHTRDPLAVAPFYEELFDVKAVAVQAKDGERQGGALNLERTELGQPRMVAGIVALGEDPVRAGEPVSSGEPTGPGAGAEAHWRLYFLTDNAEASRRLVEEAEGHVVSEQRDASGRTVLIVDDGLGAEFGLVQRGTGSRG